ncbi:MAG TPA: PrgI family protein [Candidatus Moranbacteria bacterium]|nr:PrgI family protein [Candidatus Moranbacteria bacterium]
MLINVPQYIDVEDKVAGPLTAKQLGWLIAMGVVLFILWGMLPRAGFFMAGIPVALFFVALAFYKPYGQPLGGFIVHGVLYFFKPKVYVWRRTPQPLPAVVQKHKTSEARVQNKTLTQDQLKALAELIDSRGTQASASLEGVLKKDSVSKK